MSSLVEILGRQVHLDAPRLFRSAFISHASSDRNFANLLVALLQYHGVQTWYSQDSVKAGSRFKAEVMDALSECDVLCVIVSDGAASSKWVAKEVVAYHAIRPNAPIVPLLLQKMPLGHVADDLGEYQWIDFTECMLTGFRHLLELFGREFLPERPIVSKERRSDERRSTDDRRTGEDRRADNDRRTASLIKRLRLGFWKQFEKHTGLGQFDPIELTIRNKFKVIDSLRNEVVRYQITNLAGDGLDSVEVLETVTNQVWKEWKERNIIRAVYLIEAIAEEIYHKYGVSPASRRHADRRARERRVPADRRGKSSLSS